MAKYLDPLNLASKPLAGKGLLSYRWQGAFGWTMLISAIDDDEAMVQARRSNTDAQREGLQKWVSGAYVPCPMPNAPNLKKLNCLPPNQGSNLIGMLLDTSNEAAEGLRNRVSNVHFAPAEIAIDKNCECIYFTFDDATYLGELRGRNRDLCITPGNRESESNKAIAVRVLLDRNATKLYEYAIARSLPDLNLNTQETTQAAEWTAHMRQQLRPSRRDDKSRADTAEVTRQGNRT